MAVGVLESLACERGDEGCNTQKTRISIELGIVNQDMVGANRRRGEKATYRSAVPILPLLSLPTRPFVSAASPGAATETRLNIDSCKLPARALERKLPCVAALFNNE